MSGTRGDEDGDGGTLYPPEFPGYCGNFVGGEPPSPMVHPLRYAGALSCSELEAPFNLPVYQGGGKEAKMDGGGGTVGKLGEGILGLC